MKRDEIRLISISNSKILFTFFDQQPFYENSTRARRRKGNGCLGSIQNALVATWFHLETARTQNTCLAIAFCYCNHTKIGMREDDISRATGLWVLFIGNFKLLSVVVARYYRDNGKRKLLGFVLGRGEEVDRIKDFGLGIGEGKGNGLEMLIEGAILCCWKFKKKVE